MDDVASFDTPGVPGGVQVSNIKRKKKDFSLCAQEEHRELDICYEIQNTLQINYPGKEMPTGCPFASANSGAFMYNLMMHYVTADLDAPIFSTREVASTFQMTVH